FEFEASLAYEESSRTARAFKQGKPDFLFCFVCLFVCLFLRQGFSVALEAVLKFSLVDQTGLKLTESSLSLLPSAGTKGMRHLPLVKTC
ncbi:hypothetical protein ACQP3C_28600, partial [Escherichia coli]